MGSELCGYIMCGPRKLDPAKIEAAIEETAELLVLINKVLNDEVNDEAMKELQKIIHVDPLDAILELDKFRHANAKVLVYSFVRVWECEPYTDVMSRSFPGDDTKKIVVCGDSTYGDGPEEDSAWGITERSMFLGIPAMLDVE
jgi:hypothetical protein